MSRGIKRQIAKAMKNMNDEIRNSSTSTSFYARGLSTEGFAGGYREALFDVQAALNGVTPNNSRYWPRS